MRVYSDSAIKAAQVLDGVEQDEWLLEIVVGERRILGIRYDGSWDLETEDAPEAARIFVETVAAHFAQSPVLGDHVRAEHLP